MIPLFLRVHEFFNQIERVIIFFSFDPIKCLLCLDYVRSALIMLLENLSMMKVLTAYLALELLELKMLLPVLLKLSICYEASGAWLLFAEKRSFTCVQPHVRVEITLLGEASFADCTNEWLHLLVSVLMDLQPLSSLVSLSADFTFVRLLVCVDHLMCFKMAERDKFLIAALKVADTMSISKVRAQMNFEIILLLEMLQAITKWTYNPLIKDATSLDNTYQRL
jgi:hypothetical protein